LAQIREVALTGSLFIALRGQVAKWGAMGEQVIGNDAA
jgi:hypothetical protein